MNASDFHCLRTEPLERWRGIAAALEAQPEAWEWALANIHRWLGPAPGASRTAPGVAELAAGGLQGSGETPSLARGSAAASVRCVR